MIGARRGLAAVLTLLWVLLGAATAGPAAAHAELLSSNPENGAELTVAPKQITLTFSEPVRPVRKSFSLTDDAGDTPAIAEPTGTSRTLVVPLPALGKGFWTLEFRVISVDNHPIHSSVAFFITKGAPATGTTAAKAAKATAAPATERAAAPVAANTSDDSDLVAGLAGANRWLAYLGAVLLIGVPLFVRLCWAAGAADRRVRTAVVAGAVLVPLAALFAIPLQAAQVAGTGLGGAFADGRMSDVLDARYGETMLLRIAFAAALTVALVLLLRRPGQWTTLAACIAGTAVAATYARAGHPAASAYPALTMADDAVHLVAVSVWLGGLLVLAVRLLPTPPEDCAEVLQRWSRVAMAAVVVLVVSGVIQAARELRSFSALVDTDYGRWIVAKSILLVGMLALANLGRVRVRRYAGMPVARVPAGASLGAKLAERRSRGDISRLRRSVAGELVLGVAVLVATAFLTVTSPPGGHGGAHGHAAPDNPVVLMN